MSLLKSVWKVLSYTYGIFSALHNWILFYRVSYSSCFLLLSVTESELARGREREGYFRTGESADSLDRTLFRLPVLVFLFCSTNSGHHFAGFPVAIETRGICVNFALVNEIIMFGINPKLISRISRSPSFSYSVYLWKFIAKFLQSGSKIWQMNKQTRD